MAKENKNLIIIVSVVAILIVIGAGVAVIRDSLTPVVPKGQPAEKEEMPEATGEISDMVDALEQDLIDEMEAVYEEAESYLIISDEEEINNLSQAADDVGL